MNNINNKKIEKNYNFVKTIIILSAIVLLRVIPHVANNVPLFALFAILINSSKITIKKLFLFSFISIFISDCLLKIFYHYPIFGNYCLFTYSGFSLVIFLQAYLIKKKIGLMLNSVSVTLIYWLWTNFGVWLVDAVYPLTVQGFIECYTLALPFLQYSILANVFGCLLYMVLFNKSLCYRLDNIINRSC